MMSDEEIDRDWVPNGRRPQSTIARSFSQELMDIFRIDDSVTDLDQKVDQKKHEITTQASELQALEARIREMDERLRRRRQDTNAPAPPDGLTNNATELDAKQKALLQQKAGQAAAAQIPPTPSASEDGHS